MMVILVFNGLCIKGHIVGKIGCVLQIGGMGYHCLDMLDICNAAIRKQGHF